MTCLVILQMRNIPYCILVLSCTWCMSTYTPHAMEWHTSTPRGPQVAMNEWFDGCFNFVLVLNIDYGLGGSMAHDTISCRSPPLFKMLSYYFLYVFQSPHLASHVHVSFPNFILLLSSILYTCMSIFMNQISRLYSSCRMLNDKFLNFVCISDMIVLIIIFFKDHLH